MHSKEGMRIPVRIERRDSNRLSSNPLIKMQLRCNRLNPQKVISVILDKNSILTCIDMYWFFQSKP